MAQQHASAAQHYLNPLHIYCRLRDLGLSGPVARSLCAGYERALYRPAACRTQGSRPEDSPAAAACETPAPPRARHS